MQLSADSSASDSPTMKDLDQSDASHLSKVFPAKPHSPGTSESETDTSEENESANSNQDSALDDLDGLDKDSVFEDLDNDWPSASQASESASQDVD